MSKQEWTSIADRADSLAKDIYALINKQSEDKQPRFEINMRNITEQFTKEQQDFIKVTDERDHIRVELQKYVPPMVFNDVADRAKGCGSTYYKKTDVTKAHFRIPK